MYMATGVFLLALGFGVAFWVNQGREKAAVSDKKEDGGARETGDILVLRQEAGAARDAGKVLPQENPKETREVPFTSQAPLGDWKPDQFQNGCEEASILMATLWAKGEEDPEAAKAQEKIVAIGKEGGKLFGHVIDTSAEDTRKILAAYAPDIKTFLKKNPTAEGIKEEIDKGNIVIAPASGRELGNRFYTSPGPITHMLVIYGYEKESGDFLTNDPGTKNGKGYRYKEDILMAALWDYPTAPEHSAPPPSGKRPTAMIVVER